MEKLFEAFHDLIVAQGAWGLVIALLMAAIIWLARVNSKLQDRIDAMTDQRLEQTEKIVTVAEASTTAINGIRAEISVLSGIQKAIRER